MTKYLEFVKDKRLYGPLEDSSYQFHLSLDVKDFANNMLKNRENTARQFYIMNTTYLAKKALQYSVGLHNIMNEELAKKPSFLEIKTVRFIRTRRF